MGTSLCTCTRTPPGDRTHTRCNGGAKALRELSAGQELLEFSTYEGGQRATLFLTQVDEGLIALLDHLVERRFFRTATPVFPDEEELDEQPATSPARSTSPIVRFAPVIAGRS